MPSYSFGNRWVGIAALRDPPPPTPLHEMAGRIRREPQAVVYTVGDRDLSSDRLLRAARDVRQHASSTGQRSLGLAMLRIENLVRASLPTDLDAVLERKVLQAIDGRLGRVARRESAGAGKAPRLSYSHGSAHVLHDPASDPVAVVPVVDTAWGAVYPLAPQAPDLPELPEELLSRIEHLRITDTQVRDLAMWMRWARMDEAALSMLQPVSPMNARGLGMLRTLGVKWFRLVAMSREVTSIFTPRDVQRSIQAATVSLAEVISPNVVGLLRYASIGEDGSDDAPRRIREACYQMFGAVALVTASQRAVCDFYVALQESRSRYSEHPSESPTKRLSGSGMREAPTGDASSRMMAGSVSRRLRYVTANSRPSVRLRPRAQRTESSMPKQQSAALRRLSEAFGVPVSTLLARSLMHPSWAQVNRHAAQSASGRGNAVLVSEGKHVLSALVTHRHARHLLSDSAIVPETVDVGARPSDFAVARLFSAMEVRHGLLVDGSAASRGGITETMKASAACAILAAVWREVGDLPTERQPRFLADWLAQQSPVLDPAKALDVYGAAVGTQFDFDIEERGSGEGREFRARVFVEGHEEAQWTGSWRPRKSLAISAAAADLMAYIAGDDAEYSRWFATSAEGRGLARVLMAAEVDCALTSADAAMGLVARGALGLDFLVQGDYAAFTESVDKYDAIYSRSGGGLPVVVREDLRALMLRVRLAPIWEYISALLPDRRVITHEGYPAVRRWLDSESPAKLSLVDQLMRRLSVVRTRASILDYFAECLADAATEAGLPQPETITESGEGGYLVARVAGVSMRDLVAPLLDVARAVEPSARAMTEVDTLYVEMASVGKTEGLIGQIGLAVAHDYMETEQFEQCADLLARFLGAVDHDTDMPSAVAPHAATLATLALIDFLRSALSGA